LTWFVLAAFVACAALFLHRRGLTYLHIFQQEEYDSARFLKWVFSTGSFDKRLSVALLVLGIAAYLHLGTIDAWPFWMAAALMLLAVGLIEKDPRTESKKKLVMTARATRVHWLAMELGLLLSLTITLLGGNAGLTVLIVQFVPVSLALATILLQPLEARIQARYYREAEEKLRRLAPVIIGVTGSYGKTSVKHILGHILDMAEPTLVTPGSVNTVMGISRIVRERLDVHHRYFVVEMGAYGPGSIARLCRLAPPDLGVITAIGLAHYERFKDIAVVAKTKFEIAAATIARGGKVVVSDEVLTQGLASAGAAAFADSLVVCGRSETAQARITGLRQERDGVVCEVTWKDRSFTLRAPLFGLHHGENIALAFTAACSLGLDPERCVLALRSTPQIAHRLEVKPQPEGWTLIDDAYNANPVGFQSALELLDLFAGEQIRRILISPGMVELGRAHEREHARLGAIAARHVDVFLGVRPDRIASFVEVFKAEAPAAEFIACAGIDEALAWVKANARHGDVVLIENDLPDLYERKLRL
jgi:UDP-N-acetylmuramoyl-tripeptide--D-alanyl-D-alanine ligase